MNSVEINRFGDRSCIISMGSGISREVSARVVAFYKHLHDHPIKGVVDLVPAYDSLTIIFDPQQMTFQQLSEILSRLEPKNTTVATNQFHLPVCYEIAPDKDLFCESTGLSWKEIIELHASSQYMVYMLGFLPGFLYMGEVDKRIQLPRKQVPRKQVERGAVGIAGAQTGVYPMESPGGWNIIGQTPVSLFDPTRSNPFPIEVGSTIQFFPIRKKEFDQIRKDMNFQIEKKAVNE